MHIHTEITINSPVPQIYNALTNFADYPKWNPSIEVIHRHDDQYLIVIKNPGDKAMKFPAKLYMKQNIELRWRGRIFGLPGVFTGIHCFKLTQISVNETKLAHYEHFSGILALLIWPFIKNKTLNNFIKINAALKKFVEKQEKISTADNI